jgi:hypothetical protein
MAGGEGSPGEGVAATEGPMTEPLRMAPEAEHGADNLSRQGAIELALRLDAYWQRRGYSTVRHWVQAEPLPAETARKGWGASHGSPNRAAIWTVRSNLVNGSPPRRALQAVTMGPGAFLPSRPPPC